jgi:hypothetical protein
MLAPEVADQLRSALIARWQRPEESDALLSDALAEAARDARQRQLRPEELLLALKAIEEPVAESLGRADDEARSSFRQWLVGACMRAYFADEAKG